MYADVEVQTPSLFFTSCIFPQLSPSSPERMSTKKVLCFCSRCKGLISVLPHQKRQHEDQDLRAQSSRIASSSSAPSQSYSLTDHLRERHHPQNQPNVSTPISSTSSASVGSLSGSSTANRPPSSIPTFPVVADATHQHEATFESEASFESLASTPAPVTFNDYDMEPLSRDDSDLDEDLSSEGDHEESMSRTPSGFSAAPMAASTPGAQGPSSAPTTRTGLLPTSEVDPYQYEPATASTLAVPTPADIHPNRVVYYIYMLVFWLHAQCHLPFRACNAVLACLAVILQASGVAPNPPMFTTLPSVMTSLSADPIFRIAPVCPTCMKVYPQGTSQETQCCSESIYITAATGAQQRRGATIREDLKPKLQFPHKSLEEQLAQILSVPGVEDEVEKSPLKVKRPRNAQYTDIFDGKVCRELPSHDNGLFYTLSDEASSAGELRIGLALGVDWFSYLRSQIAPSHTSCPMSFSIVDLPPHLRYRVANLLLTGIMPGPKEADVDQVHHFMRVIVNELLRLWLDGVVIITPKYPQGRRVRVALVAVVCDKPAAHKLGGFGSHSHNFFCTKCWVTKEQKASPESFLAAGFECRTDEDQRRLQKEFLECNTKTARAEFVKKHATRWSELSRLPYFDMCRMIVVDPMHNLFLGVVKTHFYHIWVQQNVLRKSKELRRLHAILADLPMPVKLGRLPSLIGEPAGGSLTADQWLVFATVVAPLAIPQIWAEFMPNTNTSNTDFLAQRGSAFTATKNERLVAAKAAAAAKRAAGRPPPADTPASSRPQRTRTKTAKAAAMQDDPDDDSDPDAIDAGAIEDSEDEGYGEQAHSGPSAKKRRRRNKVNEITPEDEERDEATPSKLHPDDPVNFLKLCLALQILVSRTISDADLDRADSLLREYCSELVKLYGLSVIRPNHHYCIHTPESVRDYGPLHEFWTFLFERLNKVLKAYKTNNHSRGEIETSFFREFHRTVQQSRILAQASRSPDVHLNQLASHMYRASADDRGTVQALAQELDDEQESGGLLFKLSDRAETSPMPYNLYHTVLKHYSDRLGPGRIHSNIALPDNPASLPLQSSATFFDHVAVDQNRYSAFNRLHSVADSTIAVSIGSSVWVGELLDIFSLNQAVTGLITFGRVQWLVPARDVDGATIWTQFQPAGVQLWEHKQYLRADDNGPGPLINLQDILGYAIRADVRIGTKHLWATIPRKR